MNKNHTPKIDPATGRLVPPTPEEAEAMRACQEKRAAKQREKEARLLRRIAGLGEAVGAHARDEVARLQDVAPIYALSGKRKDAGDLAYVGALHITGAVVEHLAWWLDVEVGMYPAVPSDSSNEFAAGYQQAIEDVRREVVQAATRG